MPLASRRDPLAFEGARAARASALAQAEIGLGDLDLLETHDCFTVAELLQYEAFGLAEPGKGGTVLTEGRTQRDGALPVNVTGVFLACKHSLPHLVAAGRGAIINVSSLASIRYLGYDYPAYMAAKAAVNQLTVALALTHARDGIRVNAVLPGLIDTPLVGQQLYTGAGDLDDARARRHEASPTGQMGTPWDVAHAAVFLASDDAAYINGVCLPVDGGLRAKCG